ncbi:hypothetical protein L6452_12045 [Arctium lappa]|uniref:Uncharacterized protein n=1 Tax=Arctium lappa TaxID=4217 RepID=A0ACB9DQQ7_ARCLA|nr:hypothetical protein L6452_12045 [Arctium lappa]
MLLNICSLIKECARIKSISGLEIRYTPKALYFTLLYFGFHFFLESFHGICVSRQPKSQSPIHSAPSSSSSPNPKP